MTDWLKEIKTRANAATEAPWGVYDQGTLVEVVAGLVEHDTGYRCRRQIARLDDEPIDNIPEHTGWDADQDYGQLVLDAEFMAAARTGIPQLLDWIDQLQAEVDSLRAEKEQLRLALIRGAA
jgi:hypothetical protein